MSLIVIGGIKHCGKTSLGRILATDYGGSFYDLDDLMMETCEKSVDSVREIWQNYGQKEFMRIEELALKNFLNWIVPKAPYKTVVLSLGGGTVENRPAMEHLKGQGFMVYISADRDLLFARIMKRGRPAFLSEINPREDFMELYQRRDRIYRESADLIFYTDDSPKHINAQKLFIKLEQSNVR